MSIVSAICAEVHLASIKEIIEKERAKLVEHKNYTSKEIGAILDFILKRCRMEISE